ncbi:hypothetical protein Sme01_69680 [Sphaerisporangium melleum]|uniref:Ester cyclase n=1 Tax=Sphaerisporangium melleum TaxID=321316 RepID=A0A917RM43_9ACTN|nr:ester cyclase [Sphaerisporangium melleum]GGL13374.1 hypothetical protein GCM10007964_64340 [Sphaerisporangium melleum]GII74492.1 hypothetical protein Sme01_69680 [Sphaerisporangium melleum]
MQDAREVKECLVQSLNAHDMAAVRTCHHPDAVLVSPAGVAEGHEQIVWYYEHLIAAFADLRITNWHILSYGDSAATEWTATGTHTGPFLLSSGRLLDPTGRRIAIRGTGIVHVENGQIITNREYYDQLEIYAQLGLELP